MPDKGILIYQGQQTTIPYEPLSQLPVLYTASGTSTYHWFCSSLFVANLSSANLTKNQLWKLHLHERCTHAHWDQINSWIRSGLLPCDKSLANELNPVCAACQYGKMHRKQHKTTQLISVTITWLLAWELVPMGWKPAFLGKCFLLMGHPPQGPTSTQPFG